MRRVKLHWWIFLGIIAGVIWGAALNAAYFEEFAQAARVEVLGVDWTPESAVARSKDIQAAIDRMFAGTLFGGMASGLSKLFLALLRMIVLPLVVASLVSGVARMRDFSRLKTVGLKAAGWYIVTSFLAIVTGLVLVNIIRPGVGVELAIAVSGVEVPQPGSVWDMLLSVVPENVFRAAANFDLLPVIFFSILFGIFMLTIKAEQRAPIEALVEGVFEVMMKMTMFVIALAPIGIAALIARLVATTGLEVFVSLSGYAFTVAGALLVHFALTLPLLFYVVTRRNPYRLMRAMSPALLTAFSTASSSGTLGVTLERAEHEVGVSNRVAGFVLPLGATVNMDGTALYECVAVLFVAQLYAHANPDFVLTFGTQMTVVALALLVSIGAAGIPHAGLVMMVIIFQAVGLPLELVALLWAVDRPLDMCRTAVNVWSDSVGATTIAHTENEIDESVLFGA
ncbi:MAG: dicarboxylate/amino acid:cation symporter [Bradymonadaceae bacterium]|nr:dicarboxylate/amino acid:cation symporter [Lujinxingiaceae bacterium]